MKNQLFTFFAIVGLFQVTTTDAIANRDSSLTEKIDEFLSFDPEVDSTVYTGYKAFSSELGGKKIRTEDNGAPVQGWVIDYYPNGNIMHKGYYVDGKLKIFKNYYDNGMLERSSKLTSYRKAHVEIFYSDGRQKSVLKYFKGRVYKWSQFLYDNEVNDIYVVKN